MVLFTYIIYKGEDMKNFYIISATCLLLLAIFDYSNIYNIGVTSNNLEGGARKS